MRLAIAVWCVIGASLIGLKAHLDRTVLKYPDVAVRAGGETYFIPRALISGTDGWHADMMRLAGCWDAREAGVVQAAAIAADCSGARALHLKIPAHALGSDAEAALRGQPLEAAFWTGYAPPQDHVVQLVEAWRGQGEWAQRRVVARDDWQLVQIMSANSPWVPLLTAMPVRGDGRELAALYAGRCYRPETLSDAGMTCALSLRFEANVAVEYSLGPDEIGGFVPVQSALRGQVERWGSR